MLTEAASDIVRTGLRDWTIGTLPRAITRGEVTAYPALADEGDGAGSGCSGPRPRRARRTRRVPAGCSCCTYRPGCAPSPRLSNERKLAMLRSPYPSLGALLDDCVACAADQVIADAGGPPWDADGFARLVAEARDALPLATARVVDVTAEVLEAAQEAGLRLQRTASPALAAALADAQAQLTALIHPQFISETGLRRLPDLVRYLRAISRRLEVAAESPGRDADRMAAVHRVMDAYQRAVGEIAPDRRSGAGVQAVRWMIEELRVSLFAQVLGTSGPVSEKRICAAIGRLADAH